jgi:hypothetical protein
MTETRAIGRTSGSRNRWLRRLAATCLALVAAIGLSPARADTELCTALTTLPATITQPGRYCLRQDFVVSPGTGAAITLQASNVVLDCNGHSVRYPSPGNGVDAKGIHSKPGFLHNEIRHCVVDGYFRGIYLQTTLSREALYAQVTDNTVLNSGWVGIHAMGGSNRIERNHVDRTHGYDDAKGIWVAASFDNALGTAVRDNQVTDLRWSQPNASAVGAGIVLCCTAVEITGNVVSGLYAPTGDQVVGVMVSSGGRAATLTGNTLLGGAALPAPLDGERSYGIYHPYGDSYQATIVCNDNIIGHFTTATNTCVAVDNTTF